MIERKTISIYAFDFEPTVAITYNLGKEDLVSNIQWWVRDDKKYDYQTLSKIRDLIRDLNIVNINTPIKDRHIFQRYQEIFKDMVVYKNYEIKTEYFNTPSLSRQIKPYRNFTLTSESQINRFITTYIKEI